jgi:methionine sulfoxide reductase heme-binding subunit
LSQSKTSNRTFKYSIWGLLATPFVYIVVRHAADTISYGKVIHETGQWSIGLLFLAMVITPLRRAFTSAKWINTLVYHRRAIGVASFAYAAHHTIVYLERKWGADLILTEGLKPSLATGWIALFVFLLLALSSNNSSVRILGRKWKPLHRSVYIAAALVFAHWALASFDPVPAYIVLGLLCAIELIRFIPNRKT